MASNDTKAGAGIAAFRAWAKDGWDFPDRETYFAIEAALTREAESGEREEDGSTSPRIANYVQAQVNVAVAAAYEAASAACDSYIQDEEACRDNYDADSDQTRTRNSRQLGARMCAERARALTPADARAALDRLIEVAERAAFARGVMHATGTSVMGLVEAEAESRGRIEGYEAMSAAKSDAISQARADERETCSAWLEERLNPDAIADARWEVDSVQRHRLARDLRSSGGHR